MLHFVSSCATMQASHYVARAVGEGQPSTAGGSFLPPDLWKGGLPMSTSEVLELCLVIIGICGLFIQAKKK